MPERTAEVGETRPLVIGLRLLVASLLLLAFAHFHGRALIELLLPLFHWEIGWLDDRYRILALGVIQSGADSVVRLDVSLQRIVVVGGQVIFPDPRGQAYVTTLTGHVLQPAILFATLLAAWPVTAWRVYAMRIAVGLPLLLALLMADVPCVLLGELWAIFAERYAPQEFFILLAWKDFLQGGGRLALGLVAGVATIVVAQRLTLR
ncbi:MAG: hypothetical protein Q7J21_09125 [Rugosibacter sp.]|nr:hypothetical protein [Rugosibacter sp.]